MFNCFIFITRKIESNLENTFSNKIIVVNQKDCIHERFSFMKELTCNPNQDVNIYIKFNFSGYL